MNDITPGNESQSDTTELSPAFPIFHNIPKALSSFPQWVSWVYTSNEHGEQCHTPISQPGSLTETYQRCLDDGFGLGFLLTDKDLFAVVHLINCFDEGTRKIKILPGEIVALLDTYTEIDDDNGLHLILMSKGEANIKSGDIEVWTQDYMIPITGEKFGTDADARPRQSQLTHIIETHLVQTWMQRVDRMQGSGNESEVLVHILTECLNTSNWLQDAHRTGLFPFLGRCWRYPELRIMVASQPYMSSKMMKDIEAAIEPYLPKKEKAERAPADISMNGHMPDADLASMLQLDAKGIKVLECFYNMSMILEHHQEWQGRIRFDAFRNLATLDGKPVNDETEYRISEWLGSHYRFGGNRRQLLSDAIKATAIKDKYDALIEWLGTLPEWDGAPRIETWMIDMCGAEDSDYSRWVGKVTLLQMMNRAFHPGCIARLVPIWNGEENQGKSTAIALLGGEWATTLKISLESKEAHMSIHGYWIAELEELDTLYKSSESRLKAFLTNTSDHYVPKYSNHSVDYPRRTVFIGTTNDSDYLRGLTGNTRFLPINTGSFDLDAIKHEREQLFAEAKEWLLEHPSAHWWEEPDGLQSTIKEQRETRRVENVFEDSLKDFLNGKGIHKYLDKTTWDEICTYYFEFKSKDQWKDKSLQMQVTDALRANGWYRKKSDGKSYWVRPGPDDSDKVPF